MLIELVKLINTLYEAMFAPLDELFEKLPFADWIIDALIDSFHMLPFLFIIFVVIGLVEFYGTEKTNTLAEHSKKTGPIFGSLLASIPQCGFSVIASTLYSRKLITKGTLLAVYLSTSDEAIPVLLAEPSKINMILPILGTKILIAVCAGYLIDLIFKAKNKVAGYSAEAIHEIEHEAMDEEEGCCHHRVGRPSKRDLIVHPLIHTLNVFVFVLAVTLFINFVVMKAGGEENLGMYFLNNSPLQPVITAVVGLIPNCAVSIAITLLYIKGAIGFGSVISGLCSSAGLGLLVLLRKNENFKDTLQILALLLSISILSGLIIQFIYN